jgi:hypothetical protein
MTRRDKQRRYEQDQPIQQDQPPVQDNWEISFEGVLHAAIDTLFTYRPVVERLAGNDNNEAMQELVRERKLSLAERLSDIAREEVMDVAIDLGRVQVREQISSPTLPLAEAKDPYDIAWNLVATWQKALQQLGQMSRLSDLKEEDFDDYHDELNRLYRQVCHDLGLPWPPPARDAADLAE